MPCRYRYGSEEFVSAETLENYILGDAGNERGDRTDLYDASVRPSSAAADDLYAAPTAVSFDFELLEFRMNEEDNSWSIAGDATTRWLDPRLAFNTSDACTAIWRVSPSHWFKVWQPNLYIKNQLETPTVATTATATMFISEMGGVTWRYHLVIRMRCLMRFSQMPFDTQQCAIMVQSLNYDARQWSVESTFCMSRAINIVSGGVPFAFSQLAHVVDIRRRHMYHVNEIFIPAFFFFLVTYCGFWIERTSAPARVSIAVLPVLITHSFINHVYDSLQQLPYYTVLTMYLTALQYFGILAVVEYAAVQYFLARERAAAKRHSQLAKLLSNIEAVEDLGSPAGGDDGGARDGDLGALNAALEEPPKPALARRKVEPVAERAVAAVRACYASADLDGDGRVSVREFTFALQNYGIYEVPAHARLALSNYRHAEGADDGDGHLTEQEFAGFLLRYEDFRIADIFPNELDWSPAHFLYHPRSLQLDIFFRWTFIPAAVAVTTIVCFYVHGDNALFSA
ncbi:GABA-A receptor [Aureococcus anophagefferens]|nr:GABA-A receptor [Aureococcus anophagefferens]